MTIHLKIENFDQLPDGGPVEFSSSNRGLEIGRAIERDWTLPDPKNYISSRHCEIRYKNDSYWLHDLSVNGTYLNGNQNRLTNPVKISDGDRIQIGHYFISVKIGDKVFDEVLPQQNTEATTNQSWDNQLWETQPDAPAAMNRKEFLPRKKIASGPDFFQDHVDMPTAKSHYEGPHPAEPIKPQSNQESPFADPGAPQPKLEAKSNSITERGASLIEAIAAGAGIPVSVLTARPEDEIGREIGEILALSTTKLSGLLKGRAAAKKMVKSSNATMLGAHHNNPLKFVPSKAEMLETIFLNNRQGYLGGVECFDDAFKDLQEHEIATFQAMQKALKKLLDELEPDAIENSLSKSSFGFKNSKAWETYVERWNAKSESFDNGMLDLFLKYFAEAYDNFSKTQSN